jgi:ferrochelatase
MEPSNTSGYDALLVVSFGGPEGMEDVMPFLSNVLRGRNVPESRMREVAHHYELFGGVSPINGQNRQLISALERELEENGPRLPVYWGNRNWRPMLADTLSRMRDEGIKNALAFVTSAYSSYSGCRQYREDVERAREAVGDGAPKVSKLRAFFNHPGFVGPNVSNLRAALAQVPEARRADALVAFTAHSIPEAMASGCDYGRQLLETCRLVSEGAGHEHWRFVFQSRSGPPTQPWLGPDIRDYLRELKEAGASDVVVAPIGFISDHMEVIYDLDTEARQLSEELGLNMIRAATVGAHPDFIKMIRELILERLDDSTPRRALGMFPPRQDTCAADCCLPGFAARTHARPASD